MKSVVLFLVVGLACGLSARARMGDSPAQAVFRYGQPVAATGRPGSLTSTQTFEKSGLTIVCGYVKGIVEMEGYTRVDRAFLPPEIEALLRTNGRHQNWTPPGAGFGLGTYRRADGATATVTQTSLVITSPKWLAALAKDKVAAGHAATASNGANPPGTPGANPNSAAHIDAPAATNAAPSTTTNAAP